MKVLDLLSSIVGAIFGVFALAFTLIGTVLTFGATLFTLGFTGLSIAFGIGGIIVLITLLL